MPRFLSISLISLPLIHLRSSSYRLGVRAARLDQLYPAEVTAALQAALLQFEVQPKEQKSERERECGGGQPLRARHGLQWRGAGACLQWGQQG